MVKSSQSPYTTHMRVLIACEFSGHVRDAFLALGHEAYSVDILDPLAHPSLFPNGVHPNHVVGDALELINSHPPHHFDLMIAHPPCTYLTAARSRLRSTSQPEILAALSFVRQLLDAPISRICVENPPGLLTSLLRPPNFTWTFAHFGVPSSKRFSCWTKNLPPLVPRILHPPTAPSVVSSLPPSPLRPYLRSVIPPPLAEEFARQYGRLPPLSTP